ncbi:peptidoglycan DD-metalloendopeptidase family protein [Candidatus Woesearchaeota archaeon]|nr:peptidoglycan DD-metalloendopeptidase family protein [Candidatus Woesearchaeota archaeon]
MARRKDTTTGRQLIAPALNGLEERVTSPDGTETASHRSPLSRGLQYTVMLAAASLVIITSLTGSGARPTAAEAAAKHPNNKIEYTDDYKRSEPQSQTGLESKIISHESTPAIYMQAAATTTATATRPPTSPIGFAFWPLSKKVKQPNGKEGELIYRITSYLDLDPTDGIRRWDGATVTDDPLSYEIFTLNGHTGIDIQPLNETGTTVYVLALTNGKATITETANGNKAVVVENNTWAIEYYHVYNILVSDGATVTTGQKIAEIITGSGKAYLHLGAIERSPLRQRDFYRDVTGQSVNTQSLWRDDNCPRFKEDIDAGVFNCLQRTYPESLATPTSTSSPTSTAVATYTPTGTPTATPNFTATPSPTGTPTATPQPPATTTATSTPTPTNIVVTPTPTGTATLTVTPTSTIAPGTPVAIVCEQSKGGRVVQSATGQQTCVYTQGLPAVLNSYTTGNQNITVTGASQGNVTSAADYRITAPVPALR